MPTVLPTAPFVRSFLVPFSKEKNGAFLTKWLLSLSRYCPYVPPAASLHHHAKLRVCCRSLRVGWGCALLWVSFSSKKSPSFFQRQQVLQLRCHFSPMCFPIHPTQPYCLCAPCAVASLHYTCMSQYNEATQKNTPLQTLRHFIGTGCHGRCANARYHQTWCLQDFLNPEASAALSGCTTLNYARRYDTALVCGQAVDTLSYDVLGASQLTKCVCALLLYPVCVCVTSLGALVSCDGLPSKSPPFGAQPRQCFRRRQHQHRWSTCCNRCGGRKASSRCPRKAAG